jgi:hypothetical protein
LSRAGRLRRATLWATVVAAGAAVVLPELRAQIAVGTCLALFVVGATHAASWSAGLRAAPPSAFDEARTLRRAAPGRPPDLEALERTLGWRSYGRRDFDHRVRPVLRRLLAFKVLAAHGVDPDADPAGARAILPDDLAWLLEASGADDDAGAIDTEHLESLVARIEAL